MAASRVAGHAEPNELSGGQIGAQSSAAATLARRF
jgi:hypothetical protein